MRILKKKSIFFQDLPSNSRLCKIKLSPLDPNLPLPKGQGHKQRLNETTLDHLRKVVQGSKTNVPLNIIRIGLVIDSVNVIDQ